MPAKTIWPDWGQIRQGWPCLVIFILLGASHLVVGFWLGRGWTIITAISAELLWLILRPWRWGGLPEPGRRAMCLSGSAALGVFIIIAMILYWRLNDA